MARARESLQRFISSSARGSDLDTTAHSGKLIIRKGSVSRLMSSKPLAQTIESCERRKMIENVSLGQKNSCAGQPDHAHDDAPDTS